MSWVFLAIIATFFWASSNILDKVLRTKYLKSSIALTASFGIFGMVFSSILFFFIGIPSIPLPNLIAAFLAGGSVPYLVIPYLKALSLEEASRVVPLWHLSPLFTLVLAVIFLNEILMHLDYTAFAFLLAGGILISTRRIGKVFRVSPATALMLLSSFMAAVWDVLMKFALNTGRFWETFLVFYFSISLSSLSLFIIRNARKDFSRTLLTSKSNFVVVLFLSVLMGFVGQILWNGAIFSGPVTLVSAFVSFQSLFVLLIATFLSLKFPHFVKEAIDAKTITTKLIAIGLMAFGLFLLSF